MHHFSILQNTYSEGVIEMTTNLRRKVVQGLVALSMIALLVAGPVDFVSADGECANTPGQTC